MLFCKVISVLRVDNGGRQWEVDTPGIEVSHTHFHVGELNVAVAQENGE